MPKAKKSKAKPKPKPRQKQKQKQYVKQSVKVNVTSSGGLGGSGGYSYPPQTQYIPQVFQDRSGENVKLQQLMDMVQKSMEKPKRVQDLPPPVPEPVGFNDTPFDPVRAIRSNPILTPRPNTSNRSILDSVNGSLFNQSMDESKYMTADEGDIEDTPNSKKRKTPKASPIIPPQDIFNPDDGQNISGDEVTFSPSSPAKVVEVPKADEEFPDAPIQPPVTRGGRRVGAGRKKTNNDNKRNMIKSIGADKYKRVIAEVGFEKPLSKLNSDELDRVIEALDGYGYLD